jgi:hypothetical protein
MSVSWRWSETLVQHSRMRPIKPKVSDAPFDGEAAFPVGATIIAKATVRPIEPE